MYDHHFLEALEHVRIARQAHERRKAGAGADQVEILGRLEVVDDERAGRFAADDQLVADLQMLQTGGQRTVLDLDAEELQRLFVVRAGNVYAAIQGFTVDLQADLKERTFQWAEAACVERECGLLV